MSKIEELKVELDIYHKQFQESLMHDLGNNHRDDVLVGGKLLGIVDRFITYVEAAEAKGDQLREALHQLVDYYGDGEYENEKKLLAQARAVLEKNEQDCPPRVRTGEKMSKIEEIREEVMSPSVNRDQLRALTLELLDYVEAAEAYNEKNIYSKDSLAAAELSYHQARRAMGLE